MSEMKTFVFTDIVQSVTLKGQMAGRSDAERDVAYVSSILSPHRRRIESGLESSGGRVVSTAGEVEAFALADDPLELSPLPLEDAARQAARARAEAWWSTHPPPPPRRGTLDDETLNKMRALGYLDGGDEVLEPGPGERAP